MLCLLLAVFGLPAVAWADQVEVADANGNVLIYQFDAADGPATFTGIRSYSDDEAKSGHIIIADVVTDASSNSHEVKYISGGVSNRSYIRSVVFGKNIVSTGGPDGEQNDAFYGCSQLESVTLNAKLETLGRFTFQNCIYLRKVNLGECTNLKTIKYSAFMDCDRLEPITIPASVTTLGERAFWGPDSLTSITFASGSQLTEIPVNCFAYCTSLTTLTLPDGIQTIGTDAFYACSSLTEITFGPNVTSFANSWSNFGYCEKLQKVVLAGTEFPFTAAFWLPANATLYVNAALVDTYRESEFTRSYHVMAIGQPTDFVVTTTAGGQLQAKVEAIGSANNVLNLTVTGPLNGTDIDYIHGSMPNIEVLNLTNASIVAGGDSYHQWDVSSNGTATINNGYGPWNTEKDIITRCMFYNMPTLRSISLPSGITKIGEYALAQDRNTNYMLTHVDIPSGVTQIDHYAFWYTGIEEVTVPAGVTRLEEYTFWNCRKLKRATLPDGITFIGNSCFSECQELEDVNMPASLETIDQYAFYDNYKRATPLVLPAGVKSIGQRAFQYNTVMPSVTFNDGLESIGYETFSQCKALVSIDVPASVTFIDAWAFEYCESLTEFTMPANFKDVPVGILYNCVNLERVTLLEGTTSIGYRAFHNCTKLTDINIANQTALTSIGYQAFMNTGFTTITLPNSITSLEGGIFYSCKQLESVNVPTGIDYVPYDYCEDCPNLKNVQMHDGIRVVRHNAFYGCKQLEAIDLNDQITDIEYNAFRDCEKLISLSTKSQTIALPSALTFIGDAAFYNTKAFTGVLTIPASVTRIDHNAFNGSAITAAVLPEGITSWGTGIFAYTPNLSSVTLPQDIKRIPNYMFQRATALKHIDLPEKVEELGYCAFESSGLESIELPDSLKLIETYAFGSSLLRTIRIPDNVKTVDWGFMQNSKHLKSAYLGRNMDYSHLIDFNYFNECDSLELIRIYAGTPPAINEWYVRNFRTNCVLEVPEDQVPLYQETDIWKDFKEIRGFFVGDVLNELDYAVLCKVFRETDGQHWEKVWDVTNDHHAAGKWAGVTTELGGGVTYYITDIDLSGLGLKGELPDSLFLLPRLKTLNLSNNLLTGDIASFRVRENSALTEVNLKGNRLTGDLYPFASKLSNVTSLDVSYNQLTDLSQPIPNTKLTADYQRLRLEMQFIDFNTHQVVADVQESVPVTDLTPGQSAVINFSNIVTYRHDYQDFDRTPSSLARVYYKNGWTYAWELGKNNEGQWDLYQDNSNNVFRAPKDSIVAYMANDPWWDWRTVLLRFNWEDGDVNADQTVDVSDLQSVIYYALRDYKPNGQMFNFTAADDNSDNLINVTDVISSVDYVLGYEEPAGARYNSYETDEFQNSSNSSNSSNSLNSLNSNLLSVNAASVTLSATDEVAALQLTIRGCSKSQLQISEDLRNRFAVAMRDVADGVRLVIYSASGRTLQPGDYELLTRLPAGASVTDVRLSDAQARRLPVSVLGSTATGISSVETDMQHAGQQVLDLGGRPVGSWSTLPQGVYIIRVNGKQYKVVKK